MSASVQEAVANEALELSWLFRQNAALKNGLPDCKKNTVTLPEQNANESISVTRTESTTAVEAANKSPSPGEGAAAEPKSSLLRRAAPLLLGTAIGAVPTTLLLWPKTQPPPAPTPQVEPVKDGDLLQWLQSQGRHLPGGEQWQTK